MKYLIMLALISSCASQSPQARTPASEDPTQALIRQFTTEDQEEDTREVQRQNPGRCYGQPPMLQPYQRGCAYMCLNGEWNLICQ